jgi:tRNA A-37 threonylcarbamoyl transferase component Bud32
MTAPAHDGLIAGRYRLVAPMGGGGTATVYRGLDTLLDLEVAVKELPLAPAADAGLRAEAIERVFREARAAARIHHPGVAEVYDVVSGEDSPYIVMQLIKGRPLAELIAEQGPLPPHEVAEIGRQVLAALVAGHVVGVLHQDLEPGNVMITPDGQAVLTAFGAAGTASDPPVTPTRTVLGRPGYLAPERANGMPATPAADLWSLGAILYAALSGQGPFDDRDDALATLSAIAGEDPPHLVGDGSLYEIVNALLRRDPAGRPAFHEIARALDAAAANAPVTADPPAATSPPAATGPPAAEALPPGPPSPGAQAGRDEGGTVRADRRARASLILTAVAGLGLVAVAVFVFVPDASHFAQAPPAPAWSSPGPAPGGSHLARRAPGGIRAPQRRPRGLRVAVFHFRRRHLDWLVLTGWSGHRPARCSARRDRSSAGIRRDGRSPARARLLPRRPLGRLGPGAGKRALRRGTRHRHGRRRKARGIRPQH